MRWFWILTPLLFGSAAPAAPAYSEEVCVVRIGGERMSFFRSQAEANFIIQGKEKDFDLRAAYLGLKSGERPLGGEDLLITAHRQYDLKKAKYKDECYRGYKGRFRRELTVQRISRRARETLDLRKGQTLKAQCAWEALVPRDGRPPSLPEEPSAESSSD